MVISNGKIRARLKDFSQITIFMGKVNISGLMAAYSTEIGKITRWMGRVYLPGSTADVTRENI